MENIIRINRKELDRLILLTEKEGYIKSIFDIATKDRFPLYKISYIFENINAGEVYHIDVNIKKGEGMHLFQCNVKTNNRMIGIANVTMKDYDPFSFDFAKNFKVMAIQKGKENWLKEVSLMTVTINLAVSYAILHPDRVFVESKGSHRIVQEKLSNVDEVIYHKLQTYIQKYQEPQKRTGIKPSHEFDVRGHMRHLKSGKTVFVRPYTKCKGRGSKIIHEYDVVK